MSEYVGGIKFSWQNIKCKGTYIFSQERKELYFYQYWKVLTNKFDGLIIQFICNLYANTYILKNIYSAYKIIPGLCTGQIEHLLS